ncbi:MAG: branched-chain amino acid ABC transporter substrate-binding protein [Thermomicrobiales bacterium]
MTDSRFDMLVRQFRSGSIDRRTFLVRASALGVGAAAVLQAGSAFAQEGTPAASPAASSDAPGATGLTVEGLGVAGVAHSTDTSKGTINLYSSWPMSGANEQIGADSAEAVKYAVEIWGGAAGGFAINYTAMDDGVAANNGSWDATTESQNATEVVNDKDAVAYIATYNSGAAEVSIPITNAANMFQISPAATAVRLTKESDTNPEGYPDVLYSATGKRNFARLVPADDIQGSASANWAINEKGAKNAYVLHDNQTYGKGVASVFQDTFIKLGGTVAGFEAYDAKAPEYQALATKIANAGVDFIYIGAIVDQNVPKLVQDLRDVLSVDDATIMGPDGIANQAYVDGSGDAAEGSFVTFGGLPPTALEGVGADWYKAMADRLGHDPDPYAVYSFECAITVLQAIDKVGEKDRAKVLEAGMGTKDFRGLIGTWSFGPTGDTTATTISLNEIKDGKIVFQKVIGAPE